MTDRSVLTTLPIELEPGSRGADAIALAVGRVISTGGLRPGDRLPPIRNVARQLAVSPSTVTEAWRSLSAYGAIVTDGRRGTFVAPSRESGGPGRYWRVPVDPGSIALDLSTGTPDPGLLPLLGPAMARVDLDQQANSYLAPAVLPELESVILSDWAYTPEAMTVVDGAQDGVDRLVEAVVTLGDAVLVTDPEFPILLDRLDAAGAKVIGIPIDDQGPIVAAVEAAMKEDPVAFFLQPRAHNPTGISLSSARAQELADRLQHSRTFIIEDDHSGPGWATPTLSMGSWLPNKTVTVRSFSKSHGPDLRLAAVGGAAQPIDKLIRRRRLGASWTSHLLQRLLLAMLCDDRVVRQVTDNHAAYDERRRAMVDGLARHGVHVAGTEGLNIWLPVADEQVALVTLAANGIGAAPGAPFRSIVDDRDHLRISIGTVREGFDELAALLAAAAGRRPSD
jgi:DNA-binding transcriptional MocR family regulator